MTGHQFIHFAVKLPRYHRIYRRYRDFTMVRKSAYAKNLFLSEMTRQIPGCVVECGTWKGGMIAGIADVLGPNRDYFLFDSFEGLPPPNVKDGEHAISWSATARMNDNPDSYHNCTASEDEARAAMSKSRATRYHLIKGWFDRTLPKFRPPAPICLLRLDADWYESTIVCLKYLFPHLADRGIILIDDYDDWDGCAKAIHEFLVSQNDGDPMARLWQFGGGGIHYITRTREPASYH